MALALSQWVYREGDHATGLVMALDGLLRLEATVGEHTVLVGVSLASGEHSINRSGAAAVHASSPHVLARQAASLR